MRYEYRCLPFDVESEVSSFGSSPSLAIHKQTERRGRRYVGVGPDLVSPYSDGTDRVDRSSDPLVGRDVVVGGDRHEGEVTEGLLSVVVCLQVYLKMR